MNFSLIDCFEDLQVFRLIRTFFQRVHPTSCCDRSQLRTVGPVRASWTALSTIPLNDMLVCWSKYLRSSFVGVNPADLARVDLGKGSELSCMTEKRSFWQKQQDQRRYLGILTSGTKLWEICSIFSRSKNQYSTQRLGVTLKSANHVVVFTHLRNRWVMSHHPLLSNFDVRSFSTNWLPQSRRSNLEYPHVKVWTRDYQRLRWHIQI